MEIAAVIMVLIISSLCTVSYFSQPKDYPFWKTANRIVSEHCHWMREKHHCLTCMWGGGSPDGKIKSISVGFDYEERILSAEELRRFLILGSVDLIRRFNRDVEIIPHLAKIPFDYHILKYFIDIVDERGACIDSKKDGDVVIASAYLMRGEIHYFYNYEGEMVSHRAFKEDFEEALNKVKAEGYDVEIPLIFVDNPSESVEMR